MLSKPAAVRLLRILLPVFIAALSFFVLSAAVPEWNYVRESLDSLQKNQTTVMRFSGAALSASVAITALPDDLATPIADSFADMNGYFVVILIVIYLERMLLTAGIRIAFVWVIPIACGLYLLSALTGRERLRSIAKRAAVLGLALVLVVPCSTHFAERVGEDYLAYIDASITETERNADVLDRLGASDDGDATVLEKVDSALRTAASGFTELLTNFKNIVKKCVNSIAILILTNFVLPLAVLAFWRWLLNMLFGVSIPPAAAMKGSLKRHGQRRGEEQEPDAAPEEEKEALTS